MKTAEWTFLAVGALAAGGTTVLTTKWMENPTQSSAATREVEPRGADPRLAEIQETLAALQEHQLQLEQALQELEQRAPMSASSRRAEGEVQRSVATWLEANFDTVLASSEWVASPSDRDSHRRTAELAVQKLLSGDWSEQSEDEFWKQLRDDGRLDDVIAILEGSVEASPFDADLRLDLATAYGQKAFDLGPGPLQGHFRSKQDGAFDAALEVVPDHWEARFGKAMALSEWPTFLGKTSEAIHQFEILAKQQETKPKSENHMQTYFFLGNLYRESGRSEEALATWRRGLAQFPGTAMLEQQVNLLAGGEEQP